MLQYTLVDQTESNIGFIVKPCMEDRTEINEYGEPSAKEWKSDFSGKHGETLMLYPDKVTDRLLLLGLGPENQLQHMHTAVHKVFFEQQLNWPAKICLDFRGLNIGVVYQCILGIQKAQYNPGHFKSANTNKTGKRELLFIVDQDEDKIIQTADEALATGFTILRIMELVDLPSNRKTPSYIAKWVSKSAAENGFDVEILTEKQLKDAGFHALLAVGQGSQEPAVLLIMRYRPPEAHDKPSIALVGKGITFDTGGISIKPSARMHMMKSDMAGGAAVIGALELAARLKLNMHIVAVVPLAENSVDAKSIKPGDVISSYSGKSIEVIDTDAEGRLILADALSFVEKEIQPETIIDLATLTGSAVRALGYEAAALFSQSEDLVNEMLQASEMTGEKLWRMPLWEEYGMAMQSDIADIKNLSSKPIAGCITAAKFLEFFVNDHPRWAHLDIAGVAFGDTSWTKEKAATGYGIRLLLQLFKNYLKHTE